MHKEIPYHQVNETHLKKEKKTVLTPFFIVETKSKSQSEQPATCPICSAVIRQSRNLRRHLELRHFKKQGPKKSKKGKKTKIY